MLLDAIHRTAAAVFFDTADHLTRLNLRAAGAQPGDTASVPAVGADLWRILRFGTQVDTRTVRVGADLPGTGSELSAQAVANYIAKYATKTISAPGLPDRPVRGTEAIAALRCGAHYKRLISVCWELSKHPAAAQLGLNRWTHNVHLMRQVLSAALTRAGRDELISRNVARLAELPGWEPGDAQPWSDDEGRDDALAGLD